MYLVGIVGGWWLARRRIDSDGPVKGKAQVDDLIFYLALGVILGGRLGYMLFYDAAGIIEEPLSVVMIWKGGMSFHGGLLGVMAATMLFCRKWGIELWPFADRVACVAPLGLFFGRLANFINGELFGRVTDVPWAVVFPRGGPDPRHPSQIYEALGEGAILCAVLLWLAGKEGRRRRTGFLTGVFLAGYGAARTVAEVFRQPDAHLGFLSFGTTMGQWLSVPLLAMGLVLMFRARPED